jgi:hypothetical protein
LPLTPDIENLFPKKHSRVTLLLFVTIARGRIFAIGTWYVEVLKLACCPYNNGIT